LGKPSGLIPVRFAGGSLHGKPFRVGRYFSQPGRSAIAFTMQIFSFVRSGHSPQSAFGQDFHRVRPVRIRNSAVATFSISFGVAVVFDISISVLFDILNVAVY
jgi:hypothetical protein